MQSVLPGAFRGLKPHSVAAHRHRLRKNVKRSEAERCGPLLERVCAGRPNQRIGPPSEARRRSRQWRHAPVHHSAQTTSSGWKNSLMKRA